MVEENGNNMDGQAPESTDYANYFVTYSYLYHQKDMLEDHRRTGQYYQAVKQNQRQFEGKVVLDVGTGSGILAIFAAQAGARKVYAVEATAMAKHARVLVKGNNVENIVDVIQGTIETVTLPEKVDIIISEWMGFFLLRESMLDSVLVARDKWLKPGGSLYPSHANMYMAPIRTNHTPQRESEFQQSMEGWGSFVDDVRGYYGVDMTCLTDTFAEEQTSYYLRTSAWADVHPSQMLSSATRFKSYDLATLTLEELLQPLEVEIQMGVPEGGPVDGFVGFFDVAFRGSKENPTDMDVILSTAPDPTGPTHWGQQVFSLHPILECPPRSVIIGTLVVSRKKENNRLLEVSLTFRVEAGDVIVHPQRTCVWHME